MPDTDDDKLVIEGRVAGRGDIIIPLSDLSPAEQQAGKQAARRLGARVKSAELDDEGVLTCRLIRTGNRSKDQHSAQISFQRLKHLIREEIEQLRESLRRVATN